ncbi:MAG: HAD family phosphatase [Candidatus Latescibacterota bacterium]|nr:MAG: HAD family phosphatase [Candidatus Latescibacterota bacterium]
MDKISQLRQLLRRARGLIFDFDGLLADSERYHFLSYNEVFARYGHVIDETEYYRYWTSLGLGVTGEIERHGLDLDPSAIRNEKMPIFTRYCEDGSIPIRDEAREMLETLSKTGKTMAIASGSPSTDVRAVLRNAGVENLFDVILGSDLVPKIKPAPDLFLRTLEAFGLPADECLVLEDAEKGMFAAITAGIPVIIIRTPETKSADFGRADLTVESHTEMIELLKNALTI